MQLTTVLRGPKNIPSRYENDLPPGANLEEGQITIIDTRGAALLIVNAKGAWTDNGLTTGGLSKIAAKRNKGRLPVSTPVGDKGQG